VFVLRIRLPVRKHVRVVPLVCRVWVRTCVRAWSFGAAAAIAATDRLIHSGSGRLTSGLLAVHCHGSQALGAVRSLRLWNCSSLIRSRSSSTQWSFSPSADLPACTLDRCAGRLECPPGHWHVWMQVDAEFTLANGEAAIAHAGTKGALKVQVVMPLRVP
jgi:hypothetical protein